MFLISLVKIIFFADQMHSCWCPSSSIKLAHTLVLSDSYYPADQLDRKFWLLRNHGFLVDITNILEKLSILFFLRFDLFLERGKGEERERNINVWLPLAHPQLETQPTSQACALTGNWTGNPLVYRVVLNPLSHTSQCEKLINFKGAVR